jgi:hypothetical protein
MVFVYSSQVTYSKHDQIREEGGVSTAEVLACHLNVSRWTRCKAYVSHRRDHSMQRQALTTCSIGSMVKNGCISSAKDYLAAARFWPAISQIRQISPQTNIISNLGTLRAADVIGVVSIISIVSDWMGRAA